jgi:hypothetical protein
MSAPVVPPARTASPSSIQRSEKWRVYAAVVTVESSGLRPCCRRWVVL